MTKKSIACIIFMLHGCTTTFIFAAFNPNTKQNSVEWLIETEELKDDARCKYSPDTPYDLIQDLNREEDLKYQTQYKNICNIETENVTFHSFDEYGYPTTQTVKQLLQQKYFPHVSDNDLIISIVPTGMASDRIYCVSVRNKPIFFLKLSNKQKSTTNLAQIQQGHIGRFGINTRYADTKLLLAQRNLPIITWVEKLFTYKDCTGKMRTIEVTHAAGGKSVFDIMTNEPIQAKLICMRSIGNALGSFQQAFMNYSNPEQPKTWRTVSHGDFQINNIFFDKTQSKVYFIDNETMQDQSPILQDFDLFVFSGWLSNIFIQSDPQETNIDLYVNLLVAFIQGYIESFPINKRSYLAKYLKETVSDINKFILTDFPDATPKLLDAIDMYEKTQI